MSILRDLRQPGSSSLKGFGERGMTLVELILALMLFVSFMGVFVAVTQVTQRFLGDSEKQLPGSSGMLVDQYALQVGMDLLADSLSQTAVSQQDIASYISKGCTYDPISEWKLLGAKPQFPPGYSLCIRSTLLTESPLQDLINKKPMARPGIYIIHALPDEVSATTQQGRRLFCRPKPFC